MKGTWKITSLMTLGDNGEKIWLTVDEYLRQNADDPEAALMTQVELVFEEDGTVLHVAPLPDDMSEEEKKELFASGEMEAYGDNGAVLEKKRWKEENGAFFYDTGVTGTVGETAVDPWVPILPLENGEVEVSTMRLKKAE